MTMLTMLKRTTAVALVAALGPLSVQAESAETGTIAADTQRLAQAAEQQGGADNVEDKDLPGLDNEEGEEAGAGAERTGEGESHEATDEQAAEQGGMDNVEEKALPGAEDEAEAEPSGQQAGETEGQQQTGATEGEDSNAVVAKVGDREIRRSDVLTVIGMLPPQLQQQSPDMLIPMALDQLVMHELILQEAKSAGLESDPDVASLAPDGAGRAKDDAMVQVWLDRELGKAVTEDKVKETYDELSQEMGDEAPDMETLRPQIEQHLRQQAFVDISKNLHEGADITLYGPDGQPLSQ